MEVVIGFLIAVLVAMTGVGAGIVTVPALMTIGGLPPYQAVGTALVFSFVIKLILVPVAAARRQVHWKTLAWMLGGGMPGVIAGSYLVGMLKDNDKTPLLQLFLGLMIASAAIVHWRAALKGVERGNSNRPRLLGGLMSLVGVEVGFSSAGAGALGSLALLSLTTLTTAEVVGTDLAFGLGLSMLGGGLHWQAGHVNQATLVSLLAGGVAGALVGSFWGTRFRHAHLRAVVAVAVFGAGLHMCWKALH